MLYVRIEFHTSVLECYNYIEEELIETSDGLMNVDLNVKVLIHVCKKGGVCKEVRVYNGSTSGSVHAAKF